MILPTIQREIWKMDDKELALKIQLIKQAAKVPDNCIEVMASQNGGVAIKLELYKKKLNATSAKFRLWI